jgi:hypothetical protein
MTTLLECHPSSTRMGWTVTNWRRSHALLSFLDGLERCLLNCHEMHQALQRVGIVHDVKARVVEVDLPVGQHHLEELYLERSFIVRERVIRSWALFKWHRWLHSTLTMYVKGFLAFASMFF